MGEGKRGRGEGVRLMTRTIATTSKIFFIHSKNPTILLPVYVIR
jgi:hypothetical protein